MSVEHWKMFFGFAFTMFFRHSRANPSPLILAYLWVLIGLLHILVVIGQSSDVNFGYIQSLC